ncbi:MAG: hypothetical protein HN576_07735 [Bacteriovoracaceae bacterium]|nr:hypothetical protein [Bacteriovoracaceae bacterium]
MKEKLLTLILTCLITLTFGTSCSNGLESNFEDISSNTISTTSETRQTTNDVTRDDDSDPTSDDLNDPQIDILTDDDRQRDDISQAFSNLDIPQDKLILLARGIFNSMLAVRQKYLISDNIALTVMVMRYIAEIGEFEIGYNDLKTSLQGFLEIANTTLSNDIWDVVNQLKKIKFGTAKGKFYVQLFTKNDKKLVYRIDEPMGDDILETLEIKNKTMIYFEDINTDEKKKEMSAFVKKKIKPIFFLPSSWFKKLNQVHEGIKQNIDIYLNAEDSKFMAVKVTAKDSKICLKSRKIKLRELYAMPGIKDGESPIPSIIFKGKTGLFSLKASIDQ